MWILSHHLRKESQMNPLPTIIKRSQIIENARVTRAQFDTFIRRERPTTERDFAILAEVTRQRSLIDNWLAAAHNACQLARNAENQPSESSSATN